MDRLFIISDSVVNAGEISRHLASSFEIQAFSRLEFPRSVPSKHTIVDLDLTDSSYLSALRPWLRRQPKGGKAIFAVERGVRHQIVQASALGATDLVYRPFDRQVLLRKLFDDTGPLLGDPTAPLIGDSEGISAGLSALQHIFAFAAGAPIKLNKVYEAAGLVVSSVEADGIVRWVASVRKHHRQTYQHCLLVSGVAAAFGRHLGFCSGDKTRLAFAGLLHDIGKAAVPIAILEKPGPLDDEERAVVAEHPVLGFDSLARAQELEPEMLDMVLHHHEYIDGSGYPDGLEGNQLSDLVRVITIADIFAALIERRAYRNPLTCDAAYQCLQEMGDKLDRDIVRELRPFARLRIEC